MIIPKGSENDIFWDEVFVDGDGHWSWCRTNERVHLKVVPTLNGQPHIGAMTRAGDRDNLYLLSYNDTAIKVNNVICLSYDLVQANLGLAG
jgi:hypothetical protein